MKRNIVSLFVWRVGIWFFTVSSFDISAASAVPMPATALSILGYTRGTPGNFIQSPRDIEVSGGYAFVTDEPNGSFDVVDISDPTSPTLSTSLLGVCSAAKGLAIRGQIAFVGCAGDNAVKEIDISNPLAPLVIGVIKGPVPGVTLQGVWTVKLNGNFLYALSRNSLAIINISNPFAPVFVSNTLLPSSTDIPRDIVFGGVDAFIATNNGLYVYDIADPATPKAIGYTQGPVPGTTLEQARSIELVGNYVLVAANEQQAIATIDITNPNNPIYVGSYRGPDPGSSFDGITDLWVSGDIAYTTNDVNYSVGIVNIGDPTKLSWLGAVPDTNDELAGVQQFASDGEYLYYIDHDLGAVGVLSGNGRFDLPFFLDAPLQAAEPMTISLFGAGLAGVVLLRRRSSGVRGVPSSHSKVPNRKR